MANSKQAQLDRFRGNRPTEASCQAAKCLTKGLRRREGGFQLSSLGNLQSKTPQSTFLCRLAQGNAVNAGYNEGIETEERRAGRGFSIIAATFGLCGGT